MSATMRAIRMTKPKADAAPVLTIENTPIPKPTTPNQILIQVKAAFIQASDILNTQGGFPNTTFPRTPGRDFAGTVVTTTSPLHGKDVFGTSGSTLSFTEDGANAEYVLVPADAVALKPASLSYAQAAGMGTPWTTALLTLTRARVVAGETVLVLGGTGLVGSAVVAVARAKGCRVLVGARAGKGDVDTADPLLAGAMEANDGRGPHVIVDTVGEGALFANALKVLGRGGRYAFISAGHVPEGMLTVDIKGLYRQEQELIGCNSVAHSQAEMAASLEALVEMMRQGSLVGPPQSSAQEIGLEEALDVYAGKRKGKFVIVF